MSDHPEKNQTLANTTNAGRPDEVVFPEEHKRRADYDPKAAKRVERQVAILFTLSAICTVLFVVGYVAFPEPAEHATRIPFFGSFMTSNLVLGLTFGGALFFIGAGVMQWAKKLMSGTEVIQERHEIRTSDEDREDALKAFNAGVEDSAWLSRPILRRSMLGAMALFPIPLVVILRDLGPLPEDKLFNTNWRPGMHIVLDPTGAKIRPQDIPVGSMVSAMPENLPEIQHEEGNLNARAKDVVLLVRMRPDQILTQQGGSADEPWDYEGILCFSKICTHVGCPVALYEQRTHHLLCPCHQSTFDLADSGNVVFGPAARELPQLPITVDEDGYLIARNGFNQPVGPSFWERA